MVTTTPFEWTKSSFRDDSLILNILERAGKSSNSSPSADGNIQVKRLEAYIANAVEHILAIETLWNNLASVALQFGAEPLHQIRDQFEYQLNARIELLEKCERASKEYHTRTNDLTFGSDQIVKCQKVLDRIRTNILLPWNSLEDLEEILLKPLQIPNQRLIELAIKNSPPATWYLESFNPFEPETIS